MVPISCENFMCTLKAKLIWQFLLNSIYFNISLTLIIHCAQIFVDLIFVVGHYPQKLNHHEKFCVYGIRRMQILYIPDNCSTTGHLPFLVWDGVQAMIGKLQPPNCLQRHIALVTPKLLNVCVTGCNLFASNEPCVSKSLTVALSIYFLYFKTV